MRHPPSNAPGQRGARTACTSTLSELAPSELARNVALSVLVMCALAGCSLGPRYHRPDIAPPEAWRTDTISTASEAGATQAATAAIAHEQTQPAASRGSAADPANQAAGAATGPAAQFSSGAVVAWPSADWWQGFGSAQLNELMSQAQRANDDIAAAVARLRQAEAQQTIAGSALFPALGASAGATRSKQKLSALTPHSPPVTFNQFSVQGNASYELDFWGKNRALLNAARFAANASRFDRATVELSVMSAVATSYFQVLELHDRLDVAERDLATAQTLLKDLSLEATVGIATALDVAQQATTVANVNATIPPLRQQLRQSLDSLAVLIGKMPQELQAPIGTLNDLSEPQVGPGLPSELLVRRPDVAEAEAQLMSANANIQAARAAFLPSIDLTAAGGFVSTALAGLLSPANQVFSLSSSVTQSIFRGGALVGGYRLERARYAELLADYHKSVLSAFSNVQDALSAAQQSAEQYRREQDAVAKARRAYEMTELQMRAGIVNVLTVLNTQTALFSAEDALVQARFAHLQALVQLFNALGGGWQQGATSVDRSSS